MSSGLLWLLRRQRKKQTDHALLTQIARSLKWRYSCSCFAVHSGDTIPKCGKVTTFDKGCFSALRLLNWCEWFPRLLALGLAARQFESFVCSRWTARREPGRYQVPSLGKLENVSKWGRSCSGFGYKEGHLCEPAISGAWQVQARRQPKAFQGLVCLDRRQETTVRKCQKQGRKPYKVAQFCV